MKKLLFIIIMLLNNSIILFSQNADFEVFFHNEIENKLICLYDILEDSNGDYVIIGETVTFFLDYTPPQVPPETPPEQFLRKYTSTGEFILEKRFNYPGYYGNRSFFMQLSDGDYLMVGYRNPIWDTLNPTFVPDVNNSVLYFTKLNQNLDIIYNKEYTFELDTAKQYTIISDQLYPRLVLTAAFEENNQIVLSFIKYVTHHPTAMQHYHEDANDSTFFWRLDMEGNIITSNFLTDSLCDLRTDEFRNNLFPNEDNNGYLYYTNIPPSGFDNAGFRLFQLDSAFNVLNEKVLSGTLGLGANPYWFYPTTLTLKRTSNHTTLAAGEADVNKGVNYCTQIMLYAEVDDNMQLIDSLWKGDFTPSERSFTPYHCMDFIDENRIFSSFVPNGAWQKDWTQPWHQKFVISMMDREMNTIKEFYYGVDSTYLWVDVIRATQDGGCIFGGIFWDFVTYPFGEKFNQYVIRKFPPEAFVGIKEAQDNDLSVAIAYPNPGTSQLCIRTTVPEASVEIFDISGRLIAQQSITSTETFFNTENWQSGTYLWRVFSQGNLVETGKWIKN